jgi:hypothetical protein
MPALGCPGQVARRQPALRAAHQHLHASLRGRAALGERVERFIAACRQMTEEGSGVRLVIDRVSDGRSSAGAA